MSRLSLSRCLSHESDRTLHSSNTMRSSLPAIASSPNKRTPLNLPQIRHPLSIRSQSEADDMDIRGSRCSGQQHKNSDYDSHPLESANYKKDLGTLHQTNIPIPKEKRQSETPFSVNSIPEGVEVTFGDSKKICLPVFGKFNFSFGIDSGKTKCNCS